VLLRRLVATGALVTGLLVALAGPVAAGTATICVPLVISRTGQPTVEQSLRVPAGTDGLAALQRDHAVRQDNGLVCAIDGYPATGCTSVTPTGDVYWAYWHRAPGAAHWTYSQVGAGSSTVEPGVAEGWSWQTGNSEAAVPPPDVDVARMCPAASAHPTPTPSPTHPRPASPAASAPPAAPTAAPRAAAATPGSPRATPPTTHPARSARSARSAAASSTPFPSPSAGRHSRLVAAQRSNPGGGIPWLPIAIGVVVAGLAGGAIARSRRTG
jgi:hypothetical protein